MPDGNFPLPWGANIQMMGQNKQHLSRGIDIIVIGVTFFVEAGLLTTADEPKS